MLLVVIGNWVLTAYPISSCYFFSELFLIFRLQRYNFFPKPPLFHRFQKCCRQRMAVEEQVGGVERDVVA